MIPYPIHQSKLHNKYLKITKYLMMFVKDKVYCTQIYLMKYEYNF